MKNVWMKGMMALALFMGLGMAQMLRADMDAKKGMETPKMPAEFDKVKALVGTWKGTADMGGDKPGEVTNTFELTSNGTAILEKVCAGSPHEMVSMYCSEGGKLTMTHYCSVGNQPKMSLMKSTDNSLVFSMKGTTGIKSAKDMHMHAMTITWKDKDHITEDWSMYIDGKNQGAKPFVLTRVK
jgi:hypothetical protein